MKKSIIEDILVEDPWIRMVNKWVNPPPRIKVEDEFSNTVPLDYSSTDVWNKITSQVGKTKPKKKGLGDTHTIGLAIYVGSILWRDDLLGVYPPRRSSCI